jgi:hypothetical protein
VATVGSSGWFPFTWYQHNPYSNTTSPGAIFMGTAARDMTLRSWHQATFVAAPNDASHYWTLTLKNSAATQKGNALSTQNNSPGAWVVESWSGASVAVTTADELLYVEVVKVGSPGAISLAGPALFVT